MKKFLKILYICAFLLICTVPLVGMLFTDGGENTEKRELAEFPSFKTEEGGFNTSFGNELESWLADHFAFRSTLVTAFGQIKSALFQSSSEDKVIIGENGWLYFAETLADYSGTEPLSDLAIANLSAKLALMQEFVTSSGADFVFTIAPNKNSIYPENMPWWYIESGEKSNAERLTEQLLRNGVNYADLFSALSADGYPQLYHALDSHWNNLGAAIGFNTILDSVGVAHKDYSILPYTVEETHSADLHGMLYPDSDKLDEQVNFGIDWEYTYTTRFKTVEDLTIRTNYAYGDGTLVMFRDSFCNALLPYFASTYENASFLRGTPYRLDEAAGADTVVIEIVERNLDLLSSQLTVFPAPVRDIDENSLDACNTTTEISDSNGYTLVSGTLPEIYSAETRVFVSDGNAVYECCRVDEDGFYAYLPENTTNELNFYIN